MSLNSYEQETVINFNRAEPLASIYTSDPVMIRQLRRDVEKNPQDFKITDIQYADGKEVSITAECPKDLIKVLGKKRTLNLSDEQRAAMAERLKKNVGGK